MTNKVLAFCLLALIAAEGFLRKYIHFNSFNWPTVIFYLLLLILGIAFFRSFKPRSKNFWIWLVVYLIIFLMMASYPFYEHLL